ncbi:MAG: AAA family ATPase [Pseudomonadota bacterium]|nr:AAA family ATPase [Pseudomonadota bacterium]
MNKVHPEFEELYNKAVESHNCEDWRELAHKFYLKKRYLSAFNWFLRAAERGDAESQYMLARMHYDGEGKPCPNIEKTIFWLKKSYENQFGYSLVLLAQMLADGHDICREHFPYSNIEDCYLDAVGKFNLFHNGDTPQIFTSFTDVETTDVKTPRSATERLDQLIGLQTVKQSVSQLEKFIHFQNKRQQAGLNTSDQAYHFSFTGNPGTGKTEVARIMGELLHELGIRKTNKVIETDRSGLIGWKVGQTAQIVKDTVEQALDGVLFIDEAYMLWDGHWTDFGQEALATLTKCMEDYRDRLTVIFAGYQEETEWLINSNAGLKSRIKYKFQFEDYTGAELARIYVKMVNDDGYLCNTDALLAIDKLMDQAIKLHDPKLGNGRFVRNAFEITLNRMAARIAGSDCHDLSTIMLTDIPRLEELTGKKPKTSDSNSSQGDNVIPF